MKFLLIRLLLLNFFNDKNLKNSKKLKIALEFFENFKIVEIDKKTRLIAGQLLRENKVYFFTDALIAATCIKNSFFLLTKINLILKKLKD